MVIQIVGKNIFFFSIMLTNTITKTSAISFESRHEPEQNIFCRWNFQMNFHQYKYCATCSVTQISPRYVPDI